MSIAAFPHPEGAGGAGQPGQQPGRSAGRLLRDAAQTLEAAEADVAQDLARRASVLSGQIAHLFADLVEVTEAVVAQGAETSSFFGFRSAEQWLAVHTNLSPAQCRALVRLAERREELPQTMERLSSGAIGVDQAGAVAKHAPAWAEGNASCIAQGTTVTQFARLMRRVSFETDPPENPERPEPKPDAPPQISLTTIDGRFHLKYQADAVTGALVEKALREAKDALFTAGNAEATLADGMAEIASRSLAAVESPSRRDHYRIMLHLNTDGTGWVEKQGALPPSLLRRVTCDGRVRPVWLTEGSPVNVGRSQRIVPERTRRLVEDRDQGCRFPGCSVQGGFVENHHITHWADGGRTDMEGLVSLCSFHHDAHHRGEFTISGTPTRPDGLRFVDRNGALIGREWEPGMLGQKGSSWFPDGWQPDRSFPRGDRLEYQWVSFMKPRELAEAEDAGTAGTGGAGAEAALPEAGVREFAWRWTAERRGAEREAARREAARWGAAGGDGDGKGVWEWLVESAKPQSSNQQEYPDRQENLGCGERGQSRSQSRSYGHSGSDEPP